MAPMQLHWDIFCRVIDNYGDIGVCWRLARQLASEHGKRVRLWVDDPGSLKPMVPSFDETLDCQQCCGVEIVRWDANSRIDTVADVVIEAFACELPPAYLVAMADKTPRPCWINLEYLSAEAWVDGCHGMASPHPSLPLTKYFFFPGFSPDSGGLLREKTLPVAPVWESSADESLDISLFCYETAPVADLLSLLTGSPQPIRLHVAPGKPLAAIVAEWGNDRARGNLRILPFDFLPQADYDALLRRCDINFVRGEDSFVRAQWAGKPFVWQIYRQDEDAHLVKLEAFLDRYTAGLNEKTANAAVNLKKAWNSGIGLAVAWGEFMAERQEIARHGRDWAARLAEKPDLAEALVKFCTLKV